MGAKGKIPMRIRKKTFSFTLMEVMVALVILALSTGLFSINSFKKTERALLAELELQRLADNTWIEILKQLQKNHPWDSHVIGAGNATNHPLPATVIDLYGFGKSTVSRSYHLSYHGNTKTNTPYRILKCTLFFKLPPFKKAKKYTFKCFVHKKM